jgi:uncharacterized protein (TIGR02266 family)
MDGFEDRRQHVRVPLELEVTLESEHNFYSGITDDISEGGIFVATHTPPPRGSTVEMTLKLPGVKEPFLVKGIVRWVREYKASCDGSPPGCGLQWQELSNEALIHIRGFVSHRETIFYDTDIDAA